MPQYLGLFESRITIAAFFLSGRGLVAGFRDAGDTFLQDTTGRLELPTDVLNQLGPGPDWLALEVAADGSRRLVYHQVVDPSPEVRDLRRRAQLLESRSRIHAEVRAFFREQGFLEADTPLVVPCPGMEPYLDSFPVGTGWLRTSPELHLKRLLAAGFDRIFQMGPCFRAGDVGSIHREEFHMLEWYRVFADLNHLIDDLTRLLARLAPLSADPDYFATPPRVITCRQLFREYLDLELLTEPESLRAKLHARGISFDESDDWDTLFFLLFLNFIEPHLGRTRPDIVINYPASQAALAKLAAEPDGALPVCHRFELYIQGMELANAFYELTDPDIQRTRFQEDRRRRMELGKVVYAIDEAFIAALASGIPPSAGIALGLDRLVTVVLGKTKLAEILPWP